jgi:hypothetical protein
MTKSVGFTTGTIIGDLEAQRKKKLPYQKPTKQDIATNTSIRFVMAVLALIFFQSIQTCSWDWYDFAGHTIIIGAVTGFVYAVELWWKRRSVKNVLTMEI